MTVLENGRVALPHQSGDSLAAVFSSPARIRRQEEENYHRAMEILDFARPRDKAHESAESLSYAEAKLLVVARLLATGAEVLLFGGPRRPAERREGKDKVHTRKSRWT